MNKERENINKNIHNYKEKIKKINDSSKSEDRQYTFIMILGFMSLYVGYDLGGFSGAIVAIASFSTIGFAGAYSTKIRNSAKNERQECSNEIQTLQDKLYKLEELQEEEKLKKIEEEEVKKSREEIEQISNDFDKEIEELFLASENKFKEKYNNNTTLLPKSSLTEHIIGNKQDFQSVNNYKLEDLNKIIYSKFNGGWKLSYYDVEIDMKKFNISWTGIYSISEKNEKSKLMGKKWRLGKNQIARLKTIPINYNKTQMAHDTPTMDIQYYFNDGSTITANANGQITNVINELLGKRLIS